jgi:uncharacterized protein involved in response to NO
LDELHRQRELLVEQAAIQRGELAAASAEFDGLIDWMNRIASILGWLRERPQVAGVSMLSAGLLALTGVRRWVGRAVMLYQVARFLHDKFFAAKAEPTLTVRDDAEAT